MEKRKSVNLLAMQAKSLLSAIILPMSDKSLVEKAEIRTFVSQYLLQPILYRVMGGWSQSQLTFRKRPPIHPRAHT